MMAFYYLFDISSDSEVRIVIFQYVEIQKTISNSRIKFTNHIQEKNERNF